MTIWFKYTKTSTTEKKLERIKKEQARDTINHWESEWWDEYGSASQSDFTAGCLYLHIHLHICLHSTLQKRDRRVQSQYRHKHTRHLFTNLTDMHACVSVHSCIPGNLVCLLVFWLLVMCMDLCVITAGAFVLWYQRIMLLFILIFLCIRLTSSTDWNKAVWTTTEYFENPLDLKPLDLHINIY